MPEDCPAQSGPCPPEIDLSCCSCLTLGDDATQEEQDQLEADIARATAQATSLLWRATGRRFGCCCVTVRPCYQPCDDPCGYASLGEGNGRGLPTPVLIDGEWFNVRCCTSCCDAKCALTLPHASICSLREVAIDGEVIPLEQFRIFDNRTLVWDSPDGACWPTCNDLAKANTEEGTWSVTYDYGEPWPSDAPVIFGDLVCELVKACRGDVSCKLPKDVVAVARQGVSMQFAPLDESGRVRTGLRDVDLWISAVNPAGIHERARSYNPDTVLRPQRRHLTWSPDA